ncbi:MAG: aminopeptidase, partial [Acidobacteriota bacterium]|nr:aminopeptidase [Acidobacteriota bacterium]
MQIGFATEPYSELRADALITYVFDTENKFDGALADINREMNGRLESLAASGELTGKPLEFVLVHFPQGLSAQRLLLVGAGKPEKFSAADLRKIAGAALRYWKPRGVKKTIFLAREGEGGPDAAQAVVEGIVLGDFESDKYRSEKKNQE